ncbi:hypothetical protein ACFQ6Q_00240 [Streptomyces sp. NPDC056437]|uniref:hypothetical protein n=1 Tax=Streptomyces sp. NPDC056437 TaxID=3345816 RepID=UPI0036C3534D
MHRFTVDYSKDRPDPRVLLNRGYFINGIPRLILACRIRGHRPVVDGYDWQHGDRERARWVVCDRCGIRPHPQGQLDPDQWQLGQKYTGPFNPTQPLSPIVRKQLINRGHDAAIRLPGAWPAKPTSDVGAQFIIGRTYGFSSEVKVGNPTSEQCLAAHISLGPIGALYIHAEDHGRFIQRRLNNTKWESRETGLRLWHGQFEWRLWAPRDHSKKSDPWWMRGSFHIDPRHYLFGRHVCTIDKMSDKVPATVHLADGTEHEVTLRLERFVHGRKRRKKTTDWRADWTTVTPEGIATGFDRHVQGASVTVSAEAVEAEEWQQEACTAIAAWVTERRTANRLQSTDSA